MNEIEISNGEKHYQLVIRNECLDQMAFLHAILAPSDETIGESRRRTNFLMIVKNKRFLQIIKQ